MSSSAPSEDPSAGDAGNHVPLAELHEAILEPALLSQLFEDIAQATEVLEISVKGGRLERASTTPVDLREAAALLTGGSVRGVQIRYRYEGTEWCDTLIRVSEGVRLVRMAPPVQER